MSSIGLILSSNMSKKVFSVDLIDRFDINNIRWMIAVIMAQIKVLFIKVSVSDSEPQIIRFKDSYLLCHSF